MSMFMPNRSRDAWRHWGNSPLWSGNVKVKASYRGNPAVDTVASKACYTSKVYFIGLGRERSCPISLTGGISDGKGGWLIPYGLQRTYALWCLFYASSAKMHFALVELVACLVHSPTSRILQQDKAFYRSDETGHSPIPLASLHIAIGFGDGWLVLLYLQYRAANFSCECEW